ncbi:MAG: DEAD/DEAH box helicase family protein [Solirubrobacteraceae bacterium]|nr:DEAD/DEAH box helicase family protein [Solirubrobacteraceae bacterium]
MRADDTRAERRISFWWTSIGQSVRMIQMPAGPALWTGPTGRLASRIEQFNRRCLAAYVENPALVEEHANAERNHADGGYGRRQVWELVQNGADVMLGDPGRVEVVLTEEHLYCANQGQPLTFEGADSILSANRSTKHGTEIGRFGLGFKSVLGVTDRPEIYSRTGSLGFDPDFARDSIRSVLPEVVEVPILRIGRTLDVAEATSGDPILRDLAEWATTVVRLPLTAGRGSWLQSDLATFPAQFLVFSPHISELVLDNRIRGSRRSVTLERVDDHVHLLREGGETDEWRVFETEFRPSLKAARDGGQVADRQTIHLQWAVPVKSRQRTGGLWAYFPTLEETTLSGVLNAPWKLNDDRTRVIEGPFNTAILERACDLVLENLEALVVRDDPGSVLDIMPARGREDRNWADAFITQRLNDQAAHHPSIPDQTGRLMPPDSLTLHPGGLPDKALKMWSRIKTRPTDWAHPSVDASTTRRSRAERFIDASADGRTATVGQWLSALVPAPPAEGPPLQASGFAILVAAETVKDRAFLDRVRATPFVVDALGELAAPADVVLPAERSTLSSAVRLVHPALARHEKARPALEALEIQQVDASLEFEWFLGTFRPNSSGADWDGFWEFASRMAPNDVIRLLDKATVGASQIRVRVTSGQFTRLPMTLLPGPIASPDVVPEVTIDVAFHGQHLDLLRQLGAVTSPSAGGASRSEPAMRDFLERTRRIYIEKVGAKGRLDAGRIDISTRNVAGPMSALSRLDEQGKVRFTKALLEAQGDFAPVEVTYANNRYPAITVEHPVVDIVRRHGLQDTGSTTVGSTSWVGPELRTWRRLLPVANIPAAAAEALKLPRALEELSDAQWREAYALIPETGDVTLAQRFYVEAARRGAPRPAQLLTAGDGGPVEVDVSFVRATASRKTASVLRAGGRAVLEVGESDVDALVEGWGVLRGDDEVATSVVAIESGSRIALVDLFPALRPMLPEAHSGLVVARCSELRLETAGAGGRESETTQVHVAGGVAYVDDALSLEQILERLALRIGLELDRTRIARIIENKLDAEIRARLRSVVEAPDAATKLSLIVSEERLRSELPASLLVVARDLDGTPDHQGLARLALAVHGVETLRIFAEDFEEAGFQPPQRWAASREALEFVRRLRFHDAFAGFPSARRSAVLEVDGPPGLNDLHEYQEAVVRAIHDLLAIDPAKGRPRGIVSLPTGAGKTRVAIEALIQAVAAGRLDSPILWVAQRDELCEQAVQAWSELWRDRGPGRRLCISRLWRSNDAEPAEGAHVVVATIDKLTASVIDSDRYAWLAKASCIVIDEAHFAIAPAYTRLLEWQGMDRHKERAPLIGLTATPFRGISEDATKRLVTRFADRRLDQAAFGTDDPYEALQKMGVLSRAEHRVLNGTDIDLNEEEFEELRKTRLLPSSAGDRLAGDVARNRELVRSIEGQPEDWTTLVFCASIDHARVMAGLLTSRGIPAATVSGQTPAAARRHYVEEFKAGRIRVLTNYAVFQEGFDAPKVRAVYVARPTYSPNVYQQMVGRGLRGPKNGGSEECLIVNVADTVKNFGEELAFRGFEHLWDARAGRGDAV